MTISRASKRLCALVSLLLVGATAQATTLYVNCSGKTGFTSIGAAVKALQSFASSGPSTINVSGACHENVVIQSIDRLTLNAVNGASVSDASAGTQDVIFIQDSRDVAVNGFTVNGGSGPSSNGVSCNEFSTCRLSGNVIQGASNGGFAVFSQSQATLDGDTLQNNGTGLVMRSASTLRAGARPFTSRGNGQGINIGREAFAYIAAAVDNNLGQGVVVQFNSTFELIGSISGNGGVGAIVREGSVARFTNAAIGSNGGPGVLVYDQSMVTFNGATVNGNGGGIDVVCNPQYPATRGTTTDIGGGSTNCVEP